MDPALVSRFNIYKFVPTSAEWLLWAEQHGIDKRIIGFIEKNPEYLDGEATADASLDRNPDRRSWERVSEIIAKIPAIDRTTEKLLAGVIGNAAAIKFVHWTREAAGVNPLLVLQDWDKAKPLLEKCAIHELSPLNEGLFRILESESDQKVLKGYAQNLEQYIKWLEAGEKREALAHWTTLFDSPAYPKAKVAIMSYSPYIFTKMVEFIKALQI
jgi:hypothetical protein